MPRSGFTGNAEARQGLLRRLDVRCGSLRASVATGAEHSGFLSWRAKLDELATCKTLATGNGLRHLVQEQATHGQASNHTFQSRGVKRLPVGIGSNSRNEVRGAERNR